MQIYIAVYEDDGEHTIRAFRTAAMAEVWRQEIANAQWRADWGNKPTEPGAIADDYFERVAFDEYFISEAVELEGVALFR